MSRISVYVVLITVLSCIYNIWYPNPVSDVIFRTLFLSTFVFCHFDKKLKIYRSRHFSHLPKWLMSKWTFWILWTILFVSYFREFIVK